MKTILLLVLLVLATQAAVEKDIVTGLNDVTHYNKTWYSGYLNISTPSAQMNSHYFFFPSQDDSISNVE